MNTTDQTTQSTTCHCGCGEIVKNTYRPGHDARHVSILVANWIRAYKVSEGAAVNENDDAMRRLPSPALKAKYLNAQAKAEAKIQAKQARTMGAAIKQERAAQRRADQRAARDAELIADIVAAEQARYEAEVAPQIEADGGEVKVGRWTYPTGSKRGSDVIYRNERRDGSGEWVEVK